MGDNYVGPGWYWVEGFDCPRYVERGGVLCYVFGTVPGEQLAIVPESNITHIPRPAQRPIVDWSVMPAWAKWVCMREDRMGLWYSEKPEQSAGHWFMTGGFGGEIPREYWPKYTGDWRNSLVERPE